MQFVVATALVLAGAVAVASPLASEAVGSTVVSSPWLPCTNATLGSGTCVPGYGSAAFNGQNGYYGVPAELSGPAQIYISPSSCPAGSPAAKSGDSCSAPFQLSISKLTVAANVSVIRVEKFGFESSSGVNASGSVATLTNPLALTGSSQGAQWCVAVPTNANPLGETCVAESNTSLPVYLDASSPPVTGTVLMCIGAEVAPNHGAFEACMQSSVSTKPLPQIRARKLTVRKTAVKKTSVKKVALPLLVSLSAPAISNHVLTVGSSANVQVTVTTNSGSLISVTLGTGLTPALSAVVTPTRPQVTNVSALANGTSRAFTFTFTARAMRAGKVKLDVRATGQISTGAAASGSAQLAVTVR